MTQAEQLKERTKHFAVRIVRMFKALPKTEEAKKLGKQILRSGTSVAANYRAVCRARSKAEFISKIGIVVEEADIVKKEKMSGLLKEANELLAIFAASQYTAKGIRNKNKPTMLQSVNDTMIKWSNSLLT